MASLNYGIEKPLMWSVRKDGLLSKSIDSIPIISNLINIVPNAKKIVFDGDNGTTVVWWDDGTKTYVHTCDGDSFREDYGLAICYMKKILGKPEFYKLVKSGIHTKRTKRHAYTSKNKGENTE